MTEARAYAVRTFGHVRTDTVSDSRRGAMVRWLSTAAGLTVGADVPDDRVAEAFETQARREACGSEVVEVILRVVEPGELSAVSFA